MKVVFYTRKQCQLCDDAKMLLQILQEELSFQMIEKDIDLDDELTEKYGLMIPVIEIDGEIVQYGQVDYISLETVLTKRMKT